jgi:hypothetical protein
MISSILRRPLAILMWAAIAASPAFPQASTATVSGTVRDQSGAVIPNAPVVLTKTDTNATARSSTNEAGLFAFPGVVPGPYKLEVTSPGMQSYEATLTVQVQQSILIDPVLQAGRTTTVVEVKDVTPVVTVDSPTLGTVLERARILTLPINGRAFTSLMITVPGMEGLRAFGERLGSAEVSLDGASLQDRYRGATEVRPPSLDTIQEFKVETNSSSAKFSRPTTVVLTTKSGTNQIHGTLFETNRNNAIGKARRREDAYEKPPYLNRNEWGGTFGGPVFLPKLYNGRDRTFFFFAYEGKKQVSPSTAGFNVPTEAMRKGDFRELVLTNGQSYTLYDPWTTSSTTRQRQPFAYGGQLNVMDPSRLSPVYKYLMQITPLPNRPVNPLWDYNYWGVTQNRQDEWTTTFRLDHRFSDGNNFYARYNQGMASAYTDEYSVPVSDGGANNILTTAPNRTLAMSWVRSISSSMTNEVLLSVSREFHRQDQKEQNVDFAGTLGLPNPFGAKAFPVITQTGFGNLKWQPVNPNFAAKTYFVFDDNVMKMKGKHQFDFGVHVRWDYLNTLGDQQSTAGQFLPQANWTGQWDTAGTLQAPRAVPFTGYALSSMALGLGSYMVRLNHGTFYGRAKEYAAYFQDKYRATQNLTLFLGLRWEAWPAYREKYNNISSFDVASRSIVFAQPEDSYYKIGSIFRPVVDGFRGMGVKFTTHDQVGMPQALAASNWKDWAPRGGFAYTATRGQKPLVVRGGVSLAYFPIPLRPWTEYSRSATPFTAYLYHNYDDSSLSPDGFGSWSLRNLPQVIAGVNSRNVIDPNVAANGMPRGANANFFDSSLPDTRQAGWNMTVEKELWLNLTAKASYFGRHTDYLEMFNDLNRAPSQYTWFATTGTAVPTGVNALANRPYDKTAYGAVQQYGKYGWGNANGVTLEVQRQYSKGFGFQMFYVMTNSFSAGGDGYNIFNYPTETYLPGWVSPDSHQRVKENWYGRDDVPQHRLNYNWLLDIPVGRNKWLGRDMGGVVNKILGGWQIAGTGSIRSNRFSLPSSNTSGTGVWPTGAPVEIYGDKHPIQDCRSGACIPGYLWWNGYINPNQINSVDANGKPNGVMGVPADYKPAAAPLNAWPVNPNRNDPMYRFYGTNTVFMNLKNGTQVQPTFDPGTHPWRTIAMAAPRTWGLDASLFKTISIRERVRVRVNADFFNVLNHPNNPTGASQEGLIMTRSSSNSARTLQLSMRLSW